MKKFTTKTLVCLALLLAMEIVLSRFCSINAWNLKIGLNFLPIALAGILFGPLAGGLVAALGDFLGAILFPIGAYFPGFTATAFITGSLFGLFLHKDQSLLKIILVVILNNLIFSLLLNSLWISILYGSPYGPLLVSRLVQIAVLIPVQILGCLLIKKILPAIRKVLS